jgi:hypothetical protein
MKKKRRSTARKKLLIHAGVHRTGTTVIQTVLAKNASQLKQRGIFYPQYYNQPDAGNHTRLAWDLNSNKTDEVALRQWAKEISRRRARVVILSAEDFSILKDLWFLDCFLETFDVEAIFYLRRQDDWLNSWYNQHVKWPFDARLCRSTPTEFLAHLDEFHWIRYFDLLERWSAKLGKERVRVRVFEAGQIENPVADFWDLCGVDFPLETGYRLNASVPVDQLELLRRLGMLQFSPNVRYQIIRALGELPNSGMYNAFPASIRRLVLDRYTTQNQKVAEQYLGRTDKILFRDLDMRGNASSAPPSLSDDFILSFVRILISIISAKGQAAE